MRLALLGLVVCSASGCKGTLRGQVALKSETGVLEVRVFNEDDIAPWLAAHAAEIKQARAAKLAELHDATVEVNKLEWNRNRVRVAGESGTASKDGVVIAADAESEKTGWYRYQYDPSKATRFEAEGKARQALGDARAKYAWNSAAYWNSRAGVERDLGIERDRSAQARHDLAAWQTSVIDALPPGGQRVITDPQGRFTVRVPRRGRVAVLASGVFEQYRQFVPLSWALWASLDGASSGEIRLDTNNTIATLTGDAVFDGR